jgi:oligosaccharide repeat unit polymerase
MGKINTHILTLSILLFTLFLFLIDDIHLLGKIYFYSISFYTVLNIYFYKKIQLIDFWNGAFVFIIVSEILQIKYYNQNLSSAVYYLLTSNNVVNIGYLYNYRKRSIFVEKNNEKARNNKTIVLLLILVVIFYTVMKLPEAIYTFKVGRNIVFTQNVGQSFFLTPLFDSIAFVFPAIIAYYFVYVKNKKVLIPFIISSPIFLILFLSGTRFPLLFSFLGFLIVIQSKYFIRIKIKHFILISFLLFTLVYGAKLMAHFRSTDTKNEQFILVDRTNENDLPTLLATSIMSNEGVVDMTSIMFDYFKNNKHLYGASTGFILYFWVPRELWPGKPTMLGNWLVREYRSGFSDAHSASFGFTGDLYADFGLFSLIFIFFIGRFLKLAETFKDRNFKLGGYNTILAAMLFPYTFFFVRSPITASMTFIAILFFFYLFKKLIIVKKT